MNEEYEKAKIQKKVLFLKTSSQMRNNVHSVTELVII